MLAVLVSRQFDSAAQVVSFLGPNSIEKQSGTTRHHRPRLSTAGSGRFRPDIKAWSERLLEAGKCEMCGNNYRPSPLTK